MYVDGWWTEIEQNGFAVIPDLLRADEVAELVQVIASADEQIGVRKRSSIYAIRNLLGSVPAIAELSTSEKLARIIRAVLGSEAIAVKGTLFDKTADANWLVPWHQDLTICVDKRIDLDGYGPWTMKAGVVNVQPPISVLERMLAVRIHLDSCDEHNGALRVLPGTHKLGRLSGVQIDSAQTEIRPVTCIVASGGAVVMRPLLLHASSPSKDPRHRRVVHIDYAATELPTGLSWFVNYSLAGSE
jgi:ectoine hydroxylase-related dioxygenase (phytanoyl-CoA dioxygenase family)